MEHEKLFLSANYIDVRNHVSVEQKIFTAESGVHFHDYFELELILNGHGRQMLNGLEYELKRGCVYFLAPADFHNIICEDQLELINLSFDESLPTSSFSEPFLRNRQSLCFCADETLLLKMMRIIDLLKEELQDQSGASAGGISLLTEYLLYLLKKNAPSGQPLPDAETSFSQSALRHLYMHFCENPSLEEVAQLCGYAPNYFGRRFLRATGKSYSDFLNTLKLNHAKLLLSSTKMTAAEIAFSCGFTSLSNFYRVFHANVGEKPLEYRARLRSHNGST